MALGKLSTKDYRHMPGEEPPSKRRKTGAFSCFAVDGSDVTLHRRSAFSPRRKAEVKGIRRKGACLRCRLLKRACSGEDPCKTCITAAQAAVNSKALMWMECIRPSFQAINIFSESTSTLHQSRIDSIIDHLSIEDVYLDFHIPFALNIDAASSHLARWLSEDGSSPSFSVVGVYSCSSNTDMLQNALDPNLARYLRLFVHLTTHLYTTGMQGGYEDYTDEEIRSVRDCVGDKLLRALDPLVRPTEIEASEDKLARLRSVFLLLLGTVVGMRYTCSDVFDQTVPQWSEQEARQEALLRLLCHYLVYIGRATALLESSSDEKTLLNRWRTQWNKPAAFTWNCNQGLEMHYRIEPPANWIVSSSEDESLSGIDVDLSEFNDISMFTEDGDLLKCTSCGTLWTELDHAGLCLICQNPEYQDEGFTQLVSFESDFSIPEDQMIDIATQFDPGMPTHSSNQPLAEGGAQRGEDPKAPIEGGVEFFPFDPDCTLLGLEAPNFGPELSFMPEDSGASVLSDFWSTGVSHQASALIQDNGKATSAPAQRSEPFSPYKQRSSQQLHICAEALGENQASTGSCLPTIPGSFNTTSLGGSPPDAGSILPSQLERFPLFSHCTRVRNVPGSMSARKSLTTAQDMRSLRVCWLCSPHDAVKGVYHVCERCQRATRSGPGDLPKTQSNSAAAFEQRQRLLI